ncbi:acid sugar phosphatase [Salipiger pallidus]|uniref:Acid sugar phosphatase n=1 Tax=Salipiger pallidus TaxID=1775170 RepID=A0A8J3EHK6_9RHOB|nr:HAD hydrolase-like protein [Salipiger pallidus]GGG79531.1 acid sugar phosphatase [Salipiger pallidus]
MTDPAVTVGDRFTRARAQLGRATRILCDLDGCIVSGDRLLPGAKRFAKAMGDRLVIVSNNSSDTRETLSRRLTALGLPVAPAAIVLAGEAALEAARQEAPGGRLCLLASDALTGMARAMGFDPMAERAEAVVLCRDTALCLGRLEMALRHLSRGVPLVVANPDLTHPGPDGPAIETGALLTLLQACHDPVRVVHVGKPAPLLFRRALGGVAPGDAVMLGDNPATDISGARAMGMAAIRLAAPGGPCGFPTLQDLA